VTALGIGVLVIAALALIVALGIVTYQRDTARMALDLYREALWRADPDEARAVAFVTTPIRKQRRSRT